MVLPTLHDVQCQYCTVSTMAAGEQGMEPEIQRLIAKHKAELQTEREKAQDNTRWRASPLEKAMLLKA